MCNKLPTNEPDRRTAGLYRNRGPCTNLFNEGIDIPETNVLVFLRHTASRIVWLQQLGRGLRKTKNKEYVHVLDFVGSLERLYELQQFMRTVEGTPRAAAFSAEGSKSSPRAAHKYP